MAHEARPDRKAPLEVLTRGVESHRHCRAKPDHWRTVGGQPFSNNYLRAAQITALAMILRISGWK